MFIIGIDPGPEESAFVIWDGKRIHEKEIISNDLLLERLTHGDYDDFAAEMITSYGKPVGKSVFETCLWLGRFVQQYKIYHFDGRILLVDRREIRLHFCDDSRAKGPYIRQALIDRFGPKGTKKKPGILYGVKEDIWDAFAVAVYTFDNL